MSVLPVFPPSVPCGSQELTTNSTPVPPAPVAAAAQPLQPELPAHPCHANLLRADSFFFNSSLPGAGSQ